jgi:3-hydroxyisobutyrate dehydrogenase-like beta-hydroxyacid dehydrogenase
MGAPIAQRLSSRFAVTVFDIDPQRAAVVPACRRSSSATDAGRSADVLMTVLPGPEELRRCMNDLLPTLRPGTLWLDLTSGDPAMTRELAGNASRHTIDLVSAPMGGTVTEATTGNLMFFVSGPADAVARATPILHALSHESGIRQAGPRAEDGQIVKLLANGLWFAHAVAASEAMLIGQALGVPVRVLHRLLRDSAGGSRFIDEHLPRLLTGDYLDTFGIDRVVEELDTIAAMRTTAGVTTPLLDASAHLHRAALDRYGPALGELLAVKLLEEHAGQQLRDTPTTNEATPTAEHGRHIRDAEHPPAPPPT